MAARGCIVRARLVAGSLVLVLIGAVASSADTQSRPDGNDTPGKFDITKTILRHPDDLVLQTTVTGNLERRDFRGGNYFLWSLDTRNDNTLDYSVFLEARRRNGRLRLLCLFLRHGDPPELTGRTGGSISGHSGTCRFAPSRVGGLPEHWNATTEYENEFDFAPNMGVFNH